MIKLNHSEEEITWINKLFSPPTGLSLGTPPVNRPPTGETEPDGLPAALPLAPPVAAPPPLLSENHNHWTDEWGLRLPRVRCHYTTLTLRWHHWLYGWMCDVRRMQVRSGEIRWPCQTLRWGEVRWGEVRWGEVRWGEVRKFNEVFTLQCSSDDIIGCTTWWQTDSRRHINICDITAPLARSELYKQFSVSYRNIFFLHVQTENEVSSRVNLTDCVCLLPTTWETHKVY